MCDAEILSTYLSTTTHMILLYIWGFSINCYHETVRAFENPDTCVTHFCITLNTWKVVLFLLWFKTKSAILHLKSSHKWRKEKSSVSHSTYHLTPLRTWYLPGIIHKEVCNGAIETEVMHQPIIIIKIL